MAEEEPEAVETPVAASPSVIKWAIAGGLAIFVGVLGAQLAAPMLTLAIYGDPNAPDEIVVEDEEPAEEALALAQDIPFEPRDPAIYVPLDPPLLASFEVDGGTRYLQMSVQAMGRVQADMDAVRTHAPALRNAFLFVMSNHRYEDIATVQGKEQLRLEMLAEAQAIMRDNIGAPGIEEIYFTSLVVQ
jgi:flagellar FliL protein